MTQNVLTVETAQPLDRQVLGIVYSALSDLNQQLPAAQRVEQSSSAVLFGAGGTLDSLALANFIVILEQQLQEHFGAPVNLTQDDPFSPVTGHFRTVHSLVSHISGLDINGKAASRAMQL